MMAAGSSDYAKASPAQYSDKEWYHGEMTADKAERELRACGNNCFLVRENEGDLVLSHIYDGEVHHSDIKYGPGWYSVKMDSTRHIFSDLTKLVTFHSGNTDTIGTKVMDERKEVQTTAQKLTFKSYSNGQARIRSAYAKGSPAEYSDKEWYHGEMTADKAERELTACGNNCFLVRESKGALILSLLLNGEAHHFNIEYGPGSYRLQTSSSGEKFSELTELVAYYLTTEGKIMQKLVPEQESNMKEVQADGHHDKSGSCDTRELAHLAEFAWYHGEISKKETKQRLNTLQVDCFLVRQSSNKIILSTKTQKSVSHDTITYGPSGYQLKGKKELFPSVFELIAHYQKFPLNGHSKVLGTACDREDYDTEYASPSTSHADTDQTRAKLSKDTISSMVYTFKPEAGDTFSTTSHFSCNEAIYWSPAQDMDSLYEQLQQKNKVPHIPRQSIILGKSLGCGEFGMVYQGVLRDKEVAVAVKTLHEDHTEEDEVRFLQEAAIMGQFKHPNVVKVLGVVTEGEPALLVLELLTKGNLRNHLQHIKCVMDGHTLLSYCRQVAFGMVYLSSKDFVHRDLAARNILVSEDEICKIADFGLSRDLENNYYISRGGKIPVKWTAPEALSHRMYSTASDVWSYGALMYEIWSVGHKPFENFSNAKAVDLIQSRFRLPPPPGCPRALYSIMMSCWHPEPSERPTFLDIVQKLCLPDAGLLEWSEEDKSVHPEAAKLGADLSCTQDLYRDLQTLYQQN